MQTIATTGLRETPDGERSPQEPLSVLRDCSVLSSRARCRSSVSAVSRRFSALGAAAVLSIGSDGGFLSSVVGAVRHDPNHRALRTDTLRSDSSRRAQACPDDRSHGVHPDGTPRRCKAVTPLQLEPRSRPGQGAYHQERDFVPLPRHRMACTRLRPRGVDGATVVGPVSSSGRLLRLIREDLRRAERRRRPVCRCGPRAPGCSLPRRNGWVAANRGTTSGVSSLLVTVENMGRAARAS